MRENGGFLDEKGRKIYGGQRENRVCGEKIERNVFLEFWGKTTFLPKIELSKFKWCFGKVQAGKSHSQSNYQLLALFYVLIKLINWKKKLALSWEKENEWIAPNEKNKHVYFTYAVIILL